MMDAVSQIVALMERNGDGDYFGEPVTQLQHALQCAQCARDAGADEEMILAALLHDVGHLLDDERAQRSGEVGVVNHDEIGGDYLRSLGFSERIAALVEGHVDAKRYLTATNPQYFERLSDASRLTLALQGGPMTPEEASAWGASEFLRDRLRLRTWDELAKDPAREVPGLEAYVDLIRRHLTTVRT